MDVTGNATTTWYCYGMYAGYSYSFESVASERTVTGLETVMRVTAATAVETVGSWDAFTGTSGSVGTSGLLTRSGTNEVRRSGSQSLFRASESLTTATQWRLFNSLVREHGHYGAGSYQFGSVVFASGQTIVTNAWTRSVVTAASTALGMETVTGQGGSMGTFGLGGASDAAHSTVTAHTTLTVDTVSTALTTTSQELRTTAQQTGQMAAASYQFDTVAFVAQKTSTSTTRTDTGATSTYQRMETTQLTNARSRVTREADRSELGSADVQEQVTRALMRVTTSVASATATSQGAASRWEAGHFNQGSYHLDSIVYTDENTSTQISLTTEVAASCFVIDSRVTTATSGSAANTFTARGHQASGSSFELNTTRVTLQAIETTVVLGHDWTDTHSRQEGQLAGFCYTLAQWSEQSGGAMRAWDVDRQAHSIETAVITTSTTGSGGAWMAVAGSSRSQTQSGSDSSTQTLTATTDSVYLAQGSSTFVASTRSAGLLVILPASVHLSLDSYVAEAASTQSTSWTQFTTRTEAVVGRGSGTQWETGTAHQTQGYLLGGLVTNQGALEAQETSVYCYTLAAVVTTEQSGSASASATLYRAGWFAHDSFSFHTIRRSEGYAEDWQFDSHYSESDVATVHSSGTMNADRSLGLVSGGRSGSNSDYSSERHSALMGRQWAATETHTLIGHTEANLRQLGYQVIDQLTLTSHEYDATTESRGCVTRMTVETQTSLGTRILSDDGSQSATATTGYDLSNSHEGRSHSREEVFSETVAFRSEAYINTTSAQTLHQSGVYANHSFALHQYDVHSLATGTFDGVHTRVTTQLTIGTTTDSEDRYDSRRTARGYAVETTSAVDFGNSRAEVTTAISESSVVTTVRDWNSSSSLRGAYANGSTAFESVVVTAAETTLYRSVVTTMAVTQAVESYSSQGTLRAMDRLNYAGRTDQNVGTTHHCASGTRIGVQTVTSVESITGAATNALYRAGRYRENAGYHFTTVVYNSSATDTISSAHALRASSTDTAILTTTHIRKSVEHGTDSGNGVNASFTSTWGLDSLSQAILVTAATATTTLTQARTRISRVYQAGEYANYSHSFSSATFESAQSGMFTQTQDHQATKLSVVHSKATITRGNGGNEYRSITPGESGESMGWHEPAGSSSSSTHNNRLETTFESRTEHRIEVTTSTHQEMGSNIALQRHLEIYAAGSFSLTSVLYVNTASLTSDAQQTTTAVQTGTGVISSTAHSTNSTMKAAWTGGPGSESDSSMQSTSTTRSLHDNSIETSQSTFTATTITVTTHMRYQAGAYANGSYALASVVYVDFQTANSQETMAEDVFRSGQQSETSVMTVGGAGPIPPAIP